MHAALVLLLLLTLAACGRGDETSATWAATNNAAAIALPTAGPSREAQGQSERGEQAELDAAPSPPQPAEADPSAITRTWFAGRWTDTGNCADAGEFAANGTYRLADGTRGMWNVQNGRLVVQHAEGRNVARLRRVDDGTIEVAADDGSVGRSIRC